jgi:flagellar hook-associated protein 3 FlgL
MLNEIWQDQEQETTAIQQLSTGLRVNEPSDDPTAAAADVLNVAEQGQTDQFIQNTTAVQGQLETADSTLSSVVEALNQAISLGTEAANGTVSSSNQQQIAQQIEGIREQIVQLANTSYEGTYLFGGTNSTTPPYTIDATEPDGVTYNGNSGTNTVEISAGQSIQTNLPGSELFQNSAGDVMGALQQMITALQSGDSASIGSATTELSTAYGQLNEQRVFYGNAVTQLTSNESYLDQEQVSLKSQQDTLVGVNEATAATNLSSAETTYDAAVAASSEILGQSTLLDYLDGKA